jgi:hypothetical protein
MRSCTCFAFAFSLLGGLAFAPVSRAVTLPEQTTIPVIFTRTLHAGKAKAGDVVTAKTMQVVLLADGEQIPKGTLVTGHIVEARPFKFDETPYAPQQPSYLSIQLDSVMVKGVATTVSTSVRAMADPITVQEALYAHGIDDPDPVGTVVMIGGAHYSPIEKQVTAGPDDDIVGYNKKQGVFARLLPGGFGCGATQTEQSVAIFSPDACGLFGFGSVHLATGASGAFRLESTHRTVTLYAGSAALLQVQ